MRKTFVLDTNVLIHDPESIFKFEENDAVIPMVVIEELDRLKKGHGEIAYSVRHALKNIDGLRERGNIAAGVPLETGGTVTIEYIPHFSDILSPDNAIIKTALHIMENTNKDKYRPVILVSKDTAVRIKAESVGLYAEDYKNDKTAIFQRYGNVLNDNDYHNGIFSVRYNQSGEDIYRLQGEDKQSKVKRGKSLENVIPKNIEQECAIDALTNPNIEVVALTGSAGTGKTVLALAAGIHQTTKRSPLYEQVLVARPVVPMGNDLGYLPGDIDDKLAPWMQPIFDNLEVIVNTPAGQFKDNTAISKYKNYQYLIDSGILHVEALTYIRGRSLPKRYFIIDEAQNLRPLDIKTIITRCGEGTKIVFTGDLNQIDTPYLDAMSNGLSYLISRFINEENFCYLNLKDSVRSRLAEQGARLLQSFSGVSLNVSRYMNKE
ncbi:MAG: PhoH family protein [Nitrospirae bacterium]|nr:PhoH family protein [Nitrospirota bacterium]